MGFQGFRSGLEHGGLDEFLPFTPAESKWKKGAVNNMNKIIKQIHKKCIIPPEI